MKRRNRAAVSVAPLRETPGNSAQAWRDPEPQAVDRASPRRSSRSCGPRSAQAIATAAGDQADGDRPGLAEVALDRPLQREADDRRRQQRQPDHRDRVEARRRAPPRSPRRAASPRSAAAVPACSATSNALRTSGSADTPSQPSSHGHQLDVTGRGDRQQLGRAVHHTRAPARGPAPALAWRHQVARVYLGVGVRAVADRRAAATSHAAATTITTTTA